MCNFFVIVLYVSFCGLVVATLSLHFAESALNNSLFFVVTVLPRVSSLIIVINISLGNTKQAQMHLSLMLT